MDHGNDCCSQAFLVMSNKPLGLLMCRKHYRFGRISWRISPRSVTSQDIKKTFVSSWVKSFHATILATWQQQLVSIFIAYIEGLYRKWSVVSLLLL